MKFKKISILIILSLLSCNKQMGLKYPFELIFVDLNINAGIKTFVGTGEINTPHYIDYQFYIPKYYEFASNIIIKSTDSAQFLFKEPLQNYSDFNKIYKSVGINKQNNNIVFKIEYFTGTTSNSWYEKATGEIEKQIIFNYYSMRYADYSENGTHIVSSMETKNEEKDFTEIIKNLGKNDTISFVKIAVVYKRK